MPKAKFVLKEPNGKDATLIYLFYRFHSNELKYSTGQKIKPRFWSKTKQRAKLSQEFSQTETLNQLLDDLARRVEDAHKELISQRRMPTVFKLKDELNKVLFKEEHIQRIGLIKFIEELIEHGSRKPGTKKQWKQTFSKLLDYQRTTKNEVDFDAINLDFYNRFVQFLKGKGHATNTIGGHIKNVKIFMNEAVARKLTTNLEYRDRKFKVTEEQVDKIYLSQEDIKVIYQMDLSKNPRLEKVRDLFIIACYTGLRFSDLIQIRKENFVNDNSQIKVRTEKTGEIVNIPIHKYVKEVISKYNGNLPAVISNQKMNEYLKEIAALAGLESDVKIGITKGGKLEHEIFKKSELVSTHTARRSFATNAFLMDVPTIAIMKITGHRTEKAFMRYIRISQEENANKLLSHPFFN